MSLEKSGFSTHNNTEHLTPTEQAPTVRRPKREKLLLAFGAVSSSLSIGLLYRELDGHHLEDWIQKYLTSLQTALPVNLQLPTPSNENLLCAIVALVLVYSYCIVRLFAEQEWRTTHLPRVCCITLPLLLTAAFLTKNLSAVFLEVFTGILNMSIIGGLVVDIARTPKTHGEMDG